jgi:uncharacterized membrane protein
MVRQWTFDFLERVWKIRRERCVIAPEIMSETSPSTVSRKRPWGLTFFGLLAAGGLAAMPFLAGEPDGEKMPDLVRFFGSFHPVFLHLPIGIFALILLQELGAMFSSRTAARQETGLFPIFCGVVSAILAVLCGFMLYHGDEGGAYAGELAERHMWGGLIFAVAACLTFIVKAWTITLGSNPAFYRLLLFGSVGVMGFTSHDGGSITHGSDHLTKYAPNPVRKVLGLEPKAEKPKAKPLEEQLVYADIVAPILDRRCVQCHKPGNSKGRLRMDTYEMLIKGGKEGPAIEPGSAEKSNIVYRVELPMDDDEHMPPEGKPQLEAHEVAIIKWWLDTGGETTMTVAASKPDAAVMEALAKIVPAGPAEEEEKKDDKKVAGPADDVKSAVAALGKEFPGALSFESQQSALITFTAVSMRGNLDDAMFAKLDKVLPHLVTVDLSATKVTDASVAKLAGASQLRLIRLAETQITDAAIDTLAKLTSLESINLYGTKVTDAGVAKLGALPNLKRLYLWQTGVTPNAIADLKAKLPNCEIITGI